MYNLVIWICLTLLESDFMLYDAIGSVFITGYFNNRFGERIDYIFPLMMVIHVLMQMIRSLTKPFPGPHATMCVMLLVWHAYLIFVNRLHTCC